MTHKQTDFNPRIGEVYVMKFGGDDCEQGGIRPGVVIQNNRGNQHSPNIIALPVTSSLKKMSQPTHVLLDKRGTGLKKDSIVLCENPERMSKNKILGYVSTLPDNYMQKIAVASMLASSVCSYLDEETLICTWKRASELNAA